MTVDIPHFKAGASLSHALERVTEPLAREIAAPGSAAPAEWQAADWSMACAVVVMQGIGPLLAARGAWSEVPGWKIFLEQQRQHTARRHARLADSLCRVDEGARTKGIAMIALKGAELHRLGVYRPGDRPMADIDLLVRPNDYRPAVQLLESLGFAAGTEDWKHYPFMESARTVRRSLGEDERQPVKIELHQRIVERLPCFLEPLRVDLLHQVAGGGVQAYPSRGALMLHLLMHAAGAMPTRKLRMIQLNDIAALAPLMSTEDWRILAQTTALDTWWAYPAMRLVARYYPATIPPAVLSRARINCPARLIRFADTTSLFHVSHSYPWVEAFPGLNWSRSVRERCAYITHRLWPKRRTAQQRRHLVLTDAWADSEWTQRSHRSRALRFLAGRQPRPTTMYAVHLAFDRPVLGSSS